MAENRALFLFGLAAVLGEICCLSAAIVALPAVLTWARVHLSGDVPKGGGATRRTI
jgi:hypothetical protein